MRGRKSFLVIVALILFVPVLSFTLPQLAVLEAILAAGIDPAAGPLITSKIEEEFVNSGKYRVLDRANIDQVLREKEFQLSSGIVRNEEIRQAGEYLGADLVVVVNVSRVGQTFVVAAKMIDVVSGEIAAQTSYERQGRIDVLLDIAKVVGGRLAGTEIVLIEVEEPEKEPEKKPEEAEAVVTTEVEPVERPPKKEREPVEFARFVVGAKVGGNLANARTDAWRDWYYRDYWDTSYGMGGHSTDEWPYSVFGLTAGAYVVVNFGRYFGVQAELLFSQKGYQYDFEDYDDTLAYMGGVTNVFKFNYLEIPILLKVRLPWRISPYAIAGAAVAVLVHATVENEYEDFTSQVLFDWNYDNPADLINDLGIELDTFDTGLVLGAGVDIPLRSVLVNLEARYTLGLIPISTDVGITNGVFSITAGAGYRF